MKRKFRVTIPAFKRVEEIHEVWAEDEDEAVEATRGEEPKEYVEDFDYYETDRSSATVDDITTDLEALAVNGKKKKEE